MKIGKLPKVQENAGDQATIGFCLASDWFRAWHDFSGPTTDRSKAKVKQSRITFDALLNVTPSFHSLKVFDMNGDGRVDEAELRHILQSAYPSITDLNINCLFNQVDVNHSGSVTFGG